MATLAQLKTILCGSDGKQGILKDSSYYDGITDRINSAVRTIAAGVKMPDGSTTPPLPDLYDMDTVETTTNPYCDLPDDYQRSVFMVSDSNGNKIYSPEGGDYYSFRLFLKQITRMDLQQTGTIYLASVKGDRLFYQGIPTTTQTLTVHFYRLPVEVSEDTDSVEGIPEHLQKRLITHGVCREVFGEWVEDIEGNMTDIRYKYHTERFYEALMEMVDFVGMDAEPLAGGVVTFEDYLT